MRTYEKFRQGLTDKELIEKTYINLVPIYGEEMWLPFYDGKYEVSNYSRIRRIYSNGKKRLLIPHINSSGYVTLTIKGVSHSTSRWAMEVWSDFPEGENIEVHHIDENMYNNHISNLSAITSQEHHQKHPYRNWISFKKRRVEYFAHNNGKNIRVLQVFDSIKEASRCTGKSVSYINRVLYDGMPSGDRGYRFVD